MFQRLATALLFRRLARDLGEVAAALRQQNALLLRLADRYAPADPPTERVEVRMDTGVSHLDATEAQLAQEYVARTQRDTGHIPDDEEVLIYLADEKTHDLHQRLVARDADLERLRAAREW
jgi:hypothetical protein